MNAGLSSPSLILGRGTKVWLKPSNAPLVGETAHTRRGVLDVKVT